MNPWITVIIIGIIVIFIEAFSQTVRNKKLDNKIKQDKEAEETPIQRYPYKKKYLFTKNEFHFYKQLQAIADKRNLIPLAKIRLADFIEVSEKSEYMKYFAKIKSKHIDFLLIDKNTLKIVAAIELDDNSHNTTKDEFKNKLFQQVNIPLIRCKGINIVEEQLQKIMNIQTQTIN